MKSIFQFLSFTLVNDLPERVSNGYIVKDYASRKCVFEKLSISLFTYFQQMMENTNSNFNSCCEAKID